MTPGQATPGQEAARIAIKGLAYHLPEQVVTNAELASAHPSWNMKLVEERAGVERRHIARPDETAFDLALAATRKLFATHPEARERVDALIFCTQSGDYIMPPNACLLHRELELGDDVFALDFNHACSGFIYGLAIARGLIGAGTARNVLLVTADTYSKYIHPEDRSARVLFGDGAAVTWLARSEGGEGLLDLQCSTSGKGASKFIIPAGGNRLPRSASTAVTTVDASGNVRSPEHIQMDGMAVLAFVNTKVPQQIRALLERNALKTQDVDLFLFHQASKLVLDALARQFALPPAKVFRNLERLGNMVSASIPIALKDALDARAVSPGNLVLLSGFGVGLSWASALIRM